MKRLSIAFALVLGLALAGLGLSQVYGEDAQQAPAACPMGAANCPFAGKGPGRMNRGKMGPGMMGPQMMGSHPMCPLMAPGAKVETKNLKNGIQVTITSDDAKTVTRLQKMAEIMRLTRELQELDEADGKE